MEASFSEPGPGKQTNLEKNTTNEKRKAAHRDKQTNPEHHKTIAFH